MLAQRIFSIKIKSPNDYVNVRSLKQQHPKLFVHSEVESAVKDSSLQASQGLRTRYVTHQSNNIHEIDRILSGSESSIVDGNQKGDPSLSSTNLLVIATISAVAFVGGVVILAMMGFGAFLCYRRSWCSQIFCFCSTKSRRQSSSPSESEKDSESNSNDDDIGDKVQTPVKSKINLKAKATRRFWNVSPSHSKNHPNGGDDSSLSPAVTAATTGPEESSPDINNSNSFRERLPGHLTRSDSKSTLNASESILSFLESAGRAYNDLNGVGHEANTSVMSSSNPYLNDGKQRRPNDDCNVNDSDCNSGNHPNDDNRISIKKKKLSKVKVNVDIAGMSLDSSSLSSPVDEYTARLGGGQYYYHNDKSKSKDNYKSSSYK